MKFHVGRYVMKNKDKVKESCHQYELPVNLNFLRKMVTRLNTQHAFAVMSIISYVFHKLTEMIL